MFVVKKNGRIDDYSDDKIISAVKKSAERAMVKIDDYQLICKTVRDELSRNYSEDAYIQVGDLHRYVEAALMKTYPAVGECYRQYRNYKTDFVKILDDVYKKQQSLLYIGDVSNANTDSTMVSTQRSLIFGQLNKNLYKKFFLTNAELQAIEDGYIYIHDMKDRLSTMNCSLLDIENILNGGFEMGNVWYNEPKTLDVAFDVISDVTMSAASQQYGGLTLPEIDKVLVPYAEKSYKKYYDEYKEINTNGTEQEANLYAVKKVRRDFEQGFQSWEYRFNTVGSSRGDYPFISISFGMDTSKFGIMASEICMKVRAGGQGKDGFKRPVLFPKLTFLYHKDLHGENAPYEWLFNIAIECSSKSMYPDFLSLSGTGYVSDIYKKYGKIISLMGCRATLSPWFVKGGRTPKDDTDEPVYIGRCNLGVISLHLPMILAKAREENKNFYDVLDYYLEMIRNLHKRTFSFLAKKKAGSNPLVWCQGGFLGGNKQPDEPIGEDTLRPMTMSFGITALNELQELYNGKSIVEDGDFALEVMKYINKRKDEYTEKDNILYAIYGRMCRIKTI